MTNKNLSLFSFSYNEEIAAEAEPKGNYIDESGVYEGIINSVTVRESSNENSFSSSVFSREVLPIPDLP